MWMRAFWCEDRVGVGARLLSKATCCWTATCQARPLSTQKRDARIAHKKIHAILRHVAGQGEAEYSGEMALTSVLKRARFSGVASRAGDSCRRPPAATATACSRAGSMGAWR